MLELTLRGFPLIYIFLGLALVLPKIPVIGPFFNIINTLIHELGHLLVALLLGGKPKKIELFKDKSGTMVAAMPSQFSSFMVSISGYLFSSLFAYFSFYMISVGYEKGFLLTLTLISLFALILWIRNRYGIIWVLGFILLNSFLIYWNQIYWIRVAALLYATFIGVEAFVSAWIVFYLSIFKPKNAGDATLLSKTTHLPPFLWGLLFALFSTLITYLILVHFFNIPPFIPFLHI
ncbi:MAG TPA: hypothetical protein GX007_04805 [Bacteroidales bacterium]|jgi:hypothetical protein|nr:hypothetical protein [Bacteroidales bacterium]